MLINKTITTITAFKSALIVVIMIFSSCGSIRKADGLTRISLVVSYPIVIMNDETNNSIKFSNLADTISIFYYDSYVLYHLYGTRDLETDKKIHDTETWFIFQKKVRYGFLFNSISDSSKGQKLLVDSFLNNRAYASANFDIPADSLYGKSESKEDEFVEKYFIKTAHGDNYPDSIYYYFTNNLSIDYSFSRKLDSIKNMKLYKIRLLYNDAFSPTYKKMLPKREFLFEIRKEAINNSKEIINFFARVKHLYK